MAVVKVECKKCAQNEAAFESAALRLWEARLEVARLEDLLETLLDERDNHDDA